MSKLWCHAGDLKVVELGTKCYQFIFTKMEEKERVMMKRPWFFDNQVLVLRPWDQKLQCGDECFTRAPLWIHVRGLPHQWTSKEVGWKLGNLFPQCLNVIIPENGSASGKIIKLYAEVDLTKPLLRGTKLTLEDEMFWVEFKYESLPTLCFYCGILGHMEKSCDRKMQDSKDAKLCEGQYGEWMRVQGRLLGRQEGRSDGVTVKQVALGNELVVGE